MHVRERALTGFSLGLALTLLAVGCDQMGASAPKKEAKVSDTACADYSKKVCDAAGAESGACTNIKSATDLMPKAACAAALADFSYTEKKLGEVRKACDELTNKLCGELGDKTETCDMVRTQTKTFPPERCTMMMEHYAEVLAPY